jgi:hypothetical protein
MVKRRHPKHISTKLSADRIKEIIREFHEPDRRDRCKLAIYRNKIKPVTGISERTFWRYLNEIEIEKPKLEDPNQLKLF